MRQFIESCLIGKTMELRFGRRLYDIMDRTRLNSTASGRVSIQSVSHADSVAKVFYSKIKEIPLQRDLPDRVLRVLDLPVIEVTSGCS
jgi:hypothetical protein